MEISKLKDYDYSYYNKGDLNIESDPLIEKIDIINNYVNIRYKVDFYKNFDWNIKREGIIAIEYPSVNPNKPWHIGHLRNALIGQALYNLLKFAGYDCIAIDYIDDLGLQVAQSYWYNKKYGKESDLKYDLQIGLEYVEAAKLYEQNKEEIEQVLKDMENKMIAREFVEKVLKAQLETASLYGIKSDLRIYESDIKNQIFEKGINLLKQKYLVYHNEGELAGTWTTKNNKVVIRSNGVPTYLGKDIVFQLWKTGFIKGLKIDKSFRSSTDGIPLSIQADKIINIIGIEQSDHQKEIKQIVESLTNVKYIHLAYQKVRLENESFSGRKGTWIGYTADELYNQAYNMIKSKELALAAIKFFILKYNYNREVIFSWDKALSTKGGSGVYLLYTYARMNSILDKAVQPELSHINDDERFMYKYILAFKIILEQSVDTLDISKISEFILKLAEDFNTYYSKYPIKDDPSRVWLLHKLKNIFEISFSILGIPIVKRI